MTVKYQCTNCNYSFTMKTDRSTIICPYCNKRSLRMTSVGPNFADKLLNDEI